MSDFSWLDEYCRALKGTVKDFKEEWNATRYLLDGKMYALCGTDNTGRPVITLKLEPLHGSYLRQRYEDIIPGYYMNKLHWNSVYLDGDVPDNILRDMIDRSYAIVFASLTKKAQKEITG